MQVTTPTLLPTERAVAPPPSTQSTSATIEVDFGAGRRLRILGPFDATLLRELVSALTSRWRFQIAVLKRERYGRSSEQLDQQLIQMQLSIEDLQTSLAERPPKVRPQPKEPIEQPARRALPPHFPREEIVHESPCSCPACGGTMRVLGEDVSEMIEYVPERYKVIRHVRPKLSCSQCQKIVQAPAPGRPIARGLAGPGFLAHVLVSKYLDHLLC